MIKIAYVIETLRAGGAERLLCTTLKYLDRRAFDPVVVVVSPPLDLADTVRGLGIPLHQLDVCGAAGIGRGVVRLVRLFGSFRPDVVHTHLYFANVCGRLAARALSVRAVVTTYHATDYANEDTGRWRFKLRKLSDLVTARWMNTAVLAVSRAVQEDCRRHLGLRRVDVLHNWIDVDEFDALDEETARAARREFGFGADDWVLINVARLRTRQKGQQHLIRAMPALRAAVPSVRLVLVGEGAERRALEDLAVRLGVNDVVVFAGPRRDVRRLLAMSDVFVFPSAHEGFGIALAEAMAMGKPVVASGLEGILEIVTDGITGLLVPPEDPEALTRALVRLSQESGLAAQLGMWARRDVRERFDVRCGIPRLEALYRSLVNGSRASDVNG